MKKIIYLMMVAAAASSRGAIPVFYDDFEAGYTNGQNFAVATNGWQASGTEAYVTNNLGFTNSKAVYMGTFVALTNNLRADTSLKVWTDFRLKPELGVDITDPQTNTSSLLYYFNSNGVVVVATPTGWRECTNDVWGNPVPAVSNDYVRMSVFQDYSTSTQAVFLNDQLILQDFRFVANLGGLTNLVVLNTDSNCLLDTVWVKTNFDAAALTNSFNGDGVADAREINDYGYARRTLYVCQTATNLVPYYGSITNALAAWRPRDSIHVISGNYSGETVALASPSNIVFEGDAFTVSNLTVSSGASATFFQAVSCVTLTVSGQVALARSAALTSTTATVAGSGQVTMASNSAFVVSGTLSVLDSGRLDFMTNSHLVATSAGVTLNGAFVISNTWSAAASSVVSMPLTFSDNFELYSPNTVVTNLKFRGWYASSNTVTIQAGRGYGGSQAVGLSVDTTLSNSISAANATNKVWTDFYLTPELGIDPTAPATNASGFLAYANEDGYLVVATRNGGWHVCSNKLDDARSPVTTLLNPTVPTRITVCQNFSDGTFAVFVAGDMVALGLNSPTNTGSYHAFIADNRDSSAYVDNVLITTAVPDGLGADGDNVNYYDWALLLVKGSIFKIR